MKSSEPPELRLITREDFVKTHCRNCVWGQTITRTTGTVVTYCTTIDEWMTDHQGNALITNCTRYLKLYPVLDNQMPGGNFNAPDVAGDGEEDSAG